MCDVEDPSQIHLHLALAGKRGKDLRTPHKQLEVAMANDLLEELRRVDWGKQKHLQGIM